MMFVVDKFNNLRRFCTVRGDTRSRRWQVYRAMSGSRYLVRNLDTGLFRAVVHSDMTSLY
nr:hypothetical protein [Kibdelosporangium sp. MJ126-NF4]CTQ94206.1 hypothetical protein [Kibdelosporangium sp. MJ126-NF4]